MRECNGCRFCCWVYNVIDVPDEVVGYQFKESLRHCQHECSKGCLLHESTKMPSTCVEFKCPYLNGEDIYKPDTFQALLEELKGDMANYIPYIDPSIPTEEVRELIEETRSIPASIFIVDKSMYVILPLDREEGGGWRTTENKIKKWEELYNKYGKSLPIEIKENVNVEMK